MKLPFFKILVSNVVNLRPYSAANVQFLYIPYFMLLAACSIYIGAHRSLIRRDRESISVVRRCRLTSG